jgi:hypothetical protein
MGERVHFSFGCGRLAENAPIREVIYQVPDYMDDWPPAGFEAGGTVASYRRTADINTQISLGEFVIRNRNKLRRLMPRVRPNMKLSVDARIKTPQRRV